MATIMHDLIARITIFILIIAGLLVSGTGCGLGSHKKSDKISEAQSLMGTIVRVDICREQATLPVMQQAYQAVWRNFEMVVSRMDVHAEDSDVARINGSDHVTVTVAPDTYHVLEEAMRMARLTNGAFDVTVRSLVDLWKKGEEQNRIPSSQELLAARASVGPENLRLLGKNVVGRRNAGTKLDLGGIAKGYAVDEAARILRHHGITRFFIDAGGDVYAGGLNCEGQPWRIGIRDPRDPSALVDVVNVSDKAVATSGDYERYYQIAGMHWSHIINPVTGFPQKEVISASVIADTALEADAVATALCVMGSKPGTEFIDNILTGAASLILVRQGPDAIEKFRSKEYKKFGDRM